MRDQQILEIFASNLEGAPPQQGKRSVISNEPFSWRTDMKLCNAELKSLCCYTWITVDYSFHLPSCDKITFKWLDSKTITTINGLEELEQHLASVRKSI